MNQIPYRQASTHAYTPIGHVGPANESLTRPLGPEGSALANAVQPDLYSFPFQHLNRSGACGGTSMTWRIHSYQVTTIWADNLPGNELSLR